MSKSAIECEEDEQLHKKHIRSQKSLEMRKRWEEALNKSRSIDSKFSFQKGSTEGEPYFDKSSKSGSVVADLVAEWDFTHSQLALASPKADATIRASRDLWKAQKEAKDESNCREPGPPRVTIGITSIFSYESIDRESTKKLIEHLRGNSNRPICLLAGVNVEGDIYVKKLDWSANSPFDVLAVAVICEDDLPLIGYTIDFKSNFKRSECNQTEYSDRKYRLALFLGKQKYEILNTLVVVDEKAYETPAMDSNHDQNEKPRENCEDVFNSENVLFTQSKNEDNADGDISGERDVSHALMRWESEHGPLDGETTWRDTFDYWDENEGFSLNHACSYDNNQLSPQATRATWVDDGDEHDDILESSCANPLSESHQCPCEDQYDWIGRANTWAEVDPGRGRARTMRTISSSSSSSSLSTALLEIRSQPVLAIVSGIFKYMSPKSSPDQNQKNHSK